MEDVGLRLFKDFTEFKFEKLLFKEETDLFLATVKNLF
jgi:hypothetical protein